MKTQNSDDEGIENEINLMKMIDHKCIVKLYGDFVDSRRRMRCIIIEFCEVNTNFRRIKKKTTKVKDHFSIFYLFTCYNVKRLH